MDKYICVYSSSSDAVEKIYFDAAKELGKLISMSGYSLIYGGAKIGLMGAVAGEVKKNNGKITGVIPEVLKNLGLVYPDCDEIITTKDMAERKLIMEEKAHAFIALPGGFGTLEELLQVVTLKQLQYLNKPVVILNINGFYTELVDFFKKLFKGNFTKQVYENLYYVTHDVNAAINYINNYKPFKHEQKWF